MCLCNSGIYCWGCVFLTAASPYKGANLSCAERRQMMSCFLYFSLLSSCCRKAGLEVNISLCKGRAGAAASARAGWVLQEQNDAHGISGTSTPAWLGFSCCFPPRWAAQAEGMDGRQHSHPHPHPHALLWWGWSPAMWGTLPWHSPVPQVCRAPPQLLLLPAREPLTFIKAKFTRTF